MSQEITIDQAIDLGIATLERFRKESLEMTFNDVTHELYNTWFKEAERDSGDAVKEFITLGDTGNAKMISPWEEDTSNVVNTDEEIKVNWVHATTNMEYNRIELAMNKGNKVRIYNYLKGKELNMFRELAELLQKKLILSPTSASDKKNPHGLASWHSLGTDDSTGAYTGYSGRYLDGSGTKYNVGEIASSSSSHPRWASWYADHNGKLGDYLVDLLAKTMRRTHFIPSLIPMKIADETNRMNFRMYSNDVIIGNLESLARKSDDMMGPELAKYYGTVVFKGVPFVYVDLLDDASGLYTTIFGTNPIFGVDHNYFKVVVLRENDFVIGKPTPRDPNHNVLRVPVDVSFAVIDRNRQRSGFLISQQ
jgi:hypothetical protein